MTDGDGRRTACKRRRKIVSAFVPDPIQRSRTISFVRWIPFLEFEMGRTISFVCRFQISARPPACVKFEFSFLEFKMGRTISFVWRFQISARPPAWVNLNSPFSNLKWVVPYPLYVDFKLVRARRLAWNLNSPFSNLKWLVETTWQVGAMSESKKYFGTLFSCNYHKKGAKWKISSRAFTWAVEK
jgi:hypothetical protein